LWRHVDSQVDTVSEKHTVSIFRAEYLRAGAITTAFH
jgi:hypothetical protein